MWVYTCHRFSHHTDFLAACVAAGWSQHAGEPSPPQGVTYDVIGPLVAPPTIGAGETLNPGAVIDARYHVNMAWHAQDVPPAFVASLVAPENPARVFAARPKSTIPIVPPVPTAISAWKGKIVLREMGKLAAVESATTKAGGRTIDAWKGASVWHRDSEFLTSMAATLGLTDEEVDDLFRAADAIKG